MKHDNTLDVGALKDWTGGETVVSGRRMHRGGDGATFQFVWSAGIVLVFNQGDCPKLDAADTAFGARFMVAPMRSKFVSRAVTAEDEEWTFPMDLDVKQKFATWMPAIADLFLEVYARGVPSDAMIPASMTQWSSAIISAANPLAEWLEERVEFTDSADDFVVLKLLREEYMVDKARGTMTDKAFDKAARAALVAMGAIARTDDRGNLAVERYSTEGGGSGTARGLFRRVARRQV